MFNFKLKALNTRQGIFEFMLQILPVVCKFLGKFCIDFARQRLVGHKADFSKDDYTFDVQSPVAFFAVA